MSIVRAFGVLGLIAVFGALALAQNVTSAFDEDYGLSRLQTYRFIVEQRADSDPLATDTITEKKIEDALEDELEAGGFRRLSEDVPADFTIAFHVRTETRTNEPGKPRSYVQGSLIVDFYDAGTKKLVWRGIASSAVGVEAVDLKLAEEKVKEAAKLLVQQFSRDRFNL